MYSKLLMPVFSIFVRGLVLGIILVYVIGLYYGVINNLGKNILLHVSEKTGLLDTELARILSTFLPIILLILVLPFSFKNKYLYIAFISLLSNYSLSLLLISIILLSYMIYYGYIYDIYYELELTSLNIALILAIIDALLVTIYPLSAISFKKIIREKSSNILPRDLIELNMGEVLRIIIYGDPHSIALSSDPHNSIIIVDRGNTLMYTYIDIIPSSKYGGYLIISYKDKLVYKLKCVYKEVNYRKILFETYYNDDLIGEYEANVEDYKDLILAFNNILESIIARLGIERDDIRNIQFYTEDDVFIPSTTKIYELNSNRVKAKIYAREKILELLRYYGRKEIYDLWETLVKRLEYLRESATGFLRKIDTVIERKNIVIRDWW